MVACSLHIGGRDKRLSLGVFPMVGLKLARQRCLELRAQAASGHDPSELRKAAKRKSTKRVDTFETIAREWHELLSPKWSSSHGDRVMRRLETYALPWLGKLPVTER